MKIPLRQYWTLLAVYLLPQWRWTVVLAVLLFSNIGLQLVNPQIIRYFVDTALSATSYAAVSGKLLNAALLFIGLAFVQQVASVLATYTGENLGWTTTNALRADLAEHCLHLDMAFHNTHTPGEMIERLDGDVTALANFFSQFAIQVLGNVLLLLGVLAMLFREDWRVGAAFCVFAFLNLLVLWRFRDIAVPHWEAERQASAELFGFLEERLAGTEDIRSNGAQGYVMRRFYTLMRVLMRKNLKAGLMFNILINTLEVLFTLGIASAFAIGAILYRQGAITIGTVSLITIYGQMILRPINAIVRQVQELQKAGAGIVRIQGLFKLQSKVESEWQSANSKTQIANGSSGPSGYRLPAGALSVEFQNVTFGYEDDAEGKPQGMGSEAQEAKIENAALPAGKERVLHEVSFTLRPGTVLGLLGRTGSGKTTLSRLLFRLYDPDGGAVCLGDGARLTDIREVDPPHLRQRVGMVTQEIQLFNATVRDNLTFFDPTVPDERILQAFRDLGLWNWYAALPKGLDTELESGGGLSAGEAQLLAFARIFLRDPGLVILDEASSRLDPATESLIERAVDKLAQGRTLIVIAHRLGTVERADDIIILEQGRIVEQGPRLALAADPATRFYGLLQTGMEEVLA
ncbi:MAG: ABC transporter ATP-binding protein [Anaerolineae bacterium]|nr:ABC transporter ATP-binding protein [Anaerolineae bacterium]